MEPLNLKSVQMWLNALRSSDYPQGKGFLHSIDESNISNHSTFAIGHDSYCCFGVACNIYHKFFIFEEEEYSSISKKFLSDDQLLYSYGEETLYLPDIVRRWLGLTDNTGSFGDRGDSLMSMNDRGYSFEELADFIETKPKGLFVKNY